MALHEYFMGKYCNTRLSTPRSFWESVPIVVRHQLTWNKISTVQSATACCFTSQNQCRKLLSRLHLRRYISINHPTTTNCKNIQLVRNTELHEQSRIKKKHEIGGNILKCVVYRLCGLVVRVSGYRYRGPGFDPRRYQIF